jgi:hypothetical protein
LQAKELWHNPAEVSGIKDELNKAKQDSARKAGMLTAIKKERDALESQHKSLAKEKESLEKKLERALQDCKAKVLSPLALSSRSPAAKLRLPPVCLPEPTLSPTDPVPRGLLTLCPWASSGPQGSYTAYMQPICSLYTAYMQRVS